MKRGLAIVRKVMMATALLCGISALLAWLRILSIVPLIAFLAAFFSLYFATTVIERDQ
jgi:hypothetical protein